MNRREMMGALCATAGAGAIMHPSIAWSAIAPPPPPLVSGPAGSFPQIVRDQGMGATDASGFVALFPLQPGDALQVWVNTQLGSPAYNGLSPYPGYMLNGSGPNLQAGATGPGPANANYGPKSVYADALNSVPAVAGVPHQFFFAEGQTFLLDQLYRNIANFHGAGAAYPVCFQSYDPADPLNTAKHGRAGTGARGPRPIWQLVNNGEWPCNTYNTTLDNGGWAFRGLEWLSSGNGQYALWGGENNNLLFENIVFNNVQVTLESEIQQDSGIASNNIVRLCSSYGQFDTNGGHICGIFSAYTNLTVEDCVFWHNGWMVGASRDDPSSAGGPDIYKHCLYLDNHRDTSSLVRRNVIVDGSAGGLSLRGNHLCHHNVIIDCPTPDIMSGGSGSDTESPNGVTQQAFCQLVMGGADINSGTPRCIGFTSSDGTPASYYAYSLYINNPGYGQVNNMWLDIVNNVPAQFSNMGMFYNRAYAFAPPAKRLVLTGAPLSIKIYADVGNVLSATSPMTNAAIYAKVGYASKDALVQAMIADPSQGWAYQIMAAAGQGFAFNFNYASSAG